MPVGVEVPCRDRSRRGSQRCGYSRALAGCSSRQALRRQIRQAMRTGGCPGVPQRTVSCACKSLSIPSNVRHSALVNGDCARRSSDATAIIPAKKITGRFGRCLAPPEKPKISRRLMAITARPTACMATDDTSSDRPHAQSSAQPIVVWPLIKNLLSTGFVLNLDQSELSNLYLLEMCQSSPLMIAGRAIAALLIGCGGRAAPSSMLGASGWFLGTLGKT